MNQRMEFDFILCGFKIPENYSGSLISVSKCEVKYKEHLFTNCIQIKYYPLAPIKSEDTLTEIVNDKLIGEIKLFFQTFSLLLARPFQIINTNVKVNGKEIKLKQPSREAPERLYNFVKLLIRQPSVYIQRYSVHIHKDGWQLLEKLVAYFRQKPIELRKKLDLSLRWFEKGSNEMSSLDRFMGYWISFNSLYENENKTEKEAIKKYIDEHIDISTAQKFVTKYNHGLKILGSYGIQLGRSQKKIEISSELFNLLKAPKDDYITILKTVLLTIYGIRNNLFHGSYDPESAVIQKQLEMGDILLSAFLKELLAKQMFGFILPETKFAARESTEI